MYIFILSLLYIFILTFTITTEQDIVNYLIKQDPQLYKCYWLIQDLREALEKDDFDRFKALINDKSTLPRYIKHLENIKDKLKILCTTMDYLMDL